MKKQNNTHTKRHSITKNQGTRSPILFPFLDDQVAMMSIPISL